MYQESPGAVLARNAFVLGVVLAVGVLAALACGGGTPAQEAEKKAPAAETQAAPVAAPAKPAAPAAAPGKPKYGGKMRTFIYGDLTGTDPYTLPYQYSSHCDHLCGMYEPLMTYEAPFDPKKGAVLVPNLATSWEFGPDGKTLTLKLRNDVKWHDGQPFTSADVVKTFMRIKDPSHKTSTRVATQFKKLYTNVEAVDQYTVRMTLEKPTNQVIAFLANWWTPILPGHILDKEGEMKWPPVGTGWFKGDWWDRQKGIGWKKNPEYWGKDAAGNRLPYLDEVEQLVITDFAPQMATLRAGQIDVWPNWPILKPSVLAPVQKELGDKSYVIQFPPSIYPDLIFNTKSGLFKDLVARKAVRLALDRKELFDVVYDGAGVVGAVIDPREYPDVALSQDEVGQISGLRSGKKALEIAQARQLLTKAGYPEKIKLQYGILTGQLLSFDELAQMVAIQLRKIGIEADVQVLPTPTQQGLQREGKWDLSQSIWAATLVDPLTAVALSLTSFGTDSGKASPSGWYSQQLDDWWLEASQTLDQAKRRELVRKIQLYSLQEDGPIIYGWLTHNVPVYKYVKNYYPGPTLFGGRYFRNVWFDKG